MIRLFLRFYFVTAFALLVSLVLAGAFISDYYKQAETNDYVRMTRALHQLFILKQNAQIQAQRPSGDAALIQNFQHEYPFIIEQTNRDYLNADIQHALTLNGVYVDIKVSWWRTDVAVLYPSAREGEVLRFTPATDFGEPYAIMIVIMEGFVLIGFAVALFFLISPLKYHVTKLVNVSEAIGHGKFDAKGDEKAPAPLGELAKAINHMAAQLHTLLEDKKIMMGAAAHELRTPLARLRFAMDVTPSMHDKQLRQHVIDMEPDLDQLEALVEEVLAFSRLSDTATKHKRELIKVDLEINALIDHLKPLREDVLIAYSGIHTPIINADHDAFERALSNVIRNAQRHAYSKVRVSVKQDSEWLDILVEDDGGGLPIEEYPKILKAFYRHDDSRNSRTGGTGLGLAIVDKILSSHGGRVEIQASPLGGLGVVLRWPILN